MCQRGWSTSIEPRVYPFREGRASAGSNLPTRRSVSLVMPSGFTATPLALGHLLSDPFRFRIPSFQRPYSWTTKEAGQLLDDVTLALDEQAEESIGGECEYFLGAMLLNSAPPLAPPAIYGAVPAFVHDVVDGQQRLVTLTILLAVLRDLLAQTDGELPSGLREH